MERFTPPLGAQLELNGLSQRFGARSVLDELDLHIPAGQFVALVGRSGCGKSTLLRLLAGLDQPSAGRIVSDAARGDTRVMFQDARLLPWKTVLDNVGLGLSGNWRPDALAALAEVGLAERAQDWPAKLSGGQRQRVALARTLVHRPRLLLLDEPLGALDALTRIDMHALIERLWQTHRFTTLLVTHDVSEAIALADRVLLIEDGKIGLDQAVDLARPRRHTDPRFAALEATVLARVLQQPELESPAPAAAPLNIVPSQLRWAL
jgi:sulfonate transport system ATP-binding protein